MEDFFCDEHFCDDINDLLEYLELEESEIADLDDDWEVTCEESTLEKMFVLDKDFISKTFIDSIDRFEDRLPENDSTIFKSLENAFHEAFDIDKLNEKIPELYYANGKTFKITKADLVKFCNNE